MTDIFITHGHGDHWFAAGLLAERFGARVVATAGTIAQMRGSVATRPLLWDKLYAGLIPLSPVTAVTVPDNRFTLEGHDLVMVEVGHADADDNSVLHVPDLGLVIAGDVIYNGVHMYLGQSAVGGFGPWRDAIDKVEALGPRHIVCGHQNSELGGDAKRTIAETRQYLDDADELLRTENTAVGYFNAKIERYPDYLGRLILWVTARALYGVREHPAEDPRPDHSHLLALTAASTVSRPSHASTPARPWARRARWDRPGGAERRRAQPGARPGGNRRPDTGPHHSRPAGWNVLVRADRVAAPPGHADQRLRLGTTAEDVRQSADAIIAAAQPAAPGDRLD